MRHLVTGGSGFLGNLIARRLAARGEAVRVLDLWEDATRPGDVEFVRCDVRDEAGVAGALRGIDVVHHNAAAVPLSKSRRLFWQVNVEGSRIVAEQSARAGIKCFIHMSSSAIYGCPKTVPITLDAAPSPVEAYGRAKLAGEREVRRVSDETGMPLIVIRPRTILGEGRLGIFQILFEWIRQGRDVYVIGSGDVGFQFVHAHDLMDAYLLALDAGRPGSYNVGTDRFGTLREALEHLIARAGTASLVRSLPETLTINALRALDWLGLSPLAPWHYLTYHKAFHFDIRPLLDLGWKPQYSNDEMFAESYDWYGLHLDRSRRERTGSPHRTAVREKVLGFIRMFS